MWHGNLDIIVNDVLAVEPLDERPETPDTPGGKSPVEVKLKTTLKKNPSNHCKNYSFFFSPEKETPRAGEFFNPMHWNRDLRTYSNRFRT